MKHVSLEPEGQGGEIVAQLFLAFRRVNQEWFLERYDPKTEESKRYTKLKWVDSESSEFAKQLRANPRQFIASASLDPISEVLYYAISLPSYFTPQDGSSLARPNAVCLEQLSPSFTVVDTRSAQPSSKVHRLGARVTSIVRAVFDSRRYVCCRWLSVGPIV